jgi:hypothetical protein
VARLYARWAWQPATFYHRPLGHPKRRITVVMQQRLFARAAALALLIGLASLADGKTRADCEKEYTPQRGQSGKDVIWIPTEDALVIRMLEMAKVSPKDKVYDLGAGDGKIAIAAGKRFGATAVGIEYNPDFAKFAQCLVEVEGVQDRVKVIQGDIFESDFSDATVVTLYLLPDLNLRLRPTLLDMKPGTRVVSHSFMMGDWDPDEQAQTNEGSAYLWIVPAKVDGFWTFRQQGGTDSFEATLDQTFQFLKGSVGNAMLTSGKLVGPKIEFAFTQGGKETRVSGTVEGDRINATVTRDGKSTNYVGTRRAGSRAGS